jgi:peptidoglycan/LPS O-acetylase OafA/YrhL
VRSPSFEETAFAGLNSFPLNLALSVAAAWTSHYLVERPFLKLERRWAPS